MRCLYCGKEIGTHRVLLDDEFCTSAHRKAYSDRLGKVLHRLAEPEPPPAPPAGFLAQIQPLEGNAGGPSFRVEFAHTAHPFRGPGAIRIPASATLADHFRRLPGANAQEGNRHIVSTDEPAGPKQVPALPVSRLSIRAALLGGTAPAAAGTLPSGCQRAAAAACAETAILGGFRHRLLFPEELPLGLCEIEEAQAPVEVPGRVDAPLPAPALASGPRPVDRGARPSAAGRIADRAAEVGLPQAEMAPLAPVEQRRAVDAPPVAPALGFTPRPLDRGAELAAAGRIEAPAVELGLPQAEIGGPALAVAGTMSMARPASPVSQAAPAAAPIEPAGFPVRLPLPAAPAYDCPALPTPGRPLPAPAAEPALREVQPSVAAEAELRTAVWIPAAPAAAEPLRTLPHGGEIAPPEPEPAEAAAQIAACALRPIPVEPAVALPLFILQIEESEPTATGLAEGASRPQPSQESWPAAAPLFPSTAAYPAETRLAVSDAVFPLVALPQMVLPQFGLAAIADLESAAPEDTLPETVPVAGVEAMELYCRPAAAAPSLSLEWIQPVVGNRIPPFAVRPVFERLQDPVAAAPVRKKPAFAEIFLLTRTADPQRRRSKLMNAAKAAAAGLFICGLVWFGRGTASIGRQMTAANQLTADGEIGGAPQSGSGAATPTPGRERPTGAVAWLRAAVARRAATRLTESFDKGMEAWGAAAGKYPAGWSYRRAGYIQPGPLAIYRPSVSFTDYRLEFFGQIEKKSMAWAVRARDSRNYYAMKVSVVETGLRPIIAIEHYSVVRGRKGHSVGMPLNVMVHNNTPVLVSVVVKGNHFTASIEGQQVDSWTDDAPASGGVGFFSDPGAHARLYWMRVSKNQDLLGRVCAYFAGGRPPETATLRPLSGEPGPAPHPAPHTGFPRAALAAVRCEWPAPGGRSAIVKHRRREQWSC